MSANWVHYFPAEAFREAGSWLSQPKSARRFFCPGRVNLIGEHLDYNGGPVLPMSIGRGIYALALPRTDTRWRVRSLQETVEYEFDAADPDSWLPADRHPFWTRYLVGIAREWYRAGQKPVGLELLLYSDLPAGSGLSSSAALEVLVATVLDAFTGAGLPPRETALLAHRAETGFVGVNCGIMDQMAVALCPEGHALRLDCHTTETRFVPFATDEYRLLILDSRAPRTLAHSAYNTRFAECRSALQLVQERDNRVQNLSQAGMELIQSVLSDQPVLFRRARHVVSETARVEAATRALETRNWTELGSLFTESHRSLAEDYEVTGPVLDALTTAAGNHPACIGARMTGAGFGGCAIALVRADGLTDFTDRVVSQIEASTGLAPRIFPALPGGPAREWGG